MALTLATPLVLLRRYDNGFVPIAVVFNSIADNLKTIHSKTREFEDHG